MNRITLILAGALVSLGTTAAHAQTVDCVCSSTFSVGDRVQALVENPSAANGIPQGTLGTVICGQNVFPGFDILVRWDNFSNGESLNVDACSCGSQPFGSGTRADWYVLCAEIQRVINVRNVTQGTGFSTLQTALNAASNGDELQIDPVILMEDNIVVPAGLTVTIRGAGRDQTIIDGMGAASPTNSIFSLPSQNNSTVHVSDLTLRNGHIDVALRGGAVTCFDSTMSFTRVDFVDNQNNATSGVRPAHVEAGAANVTFDRCRVRGGVGNDSLRIIDGTFLLRNCLIADAPTARVVRGDFFSTITFVNTTVFGTVDAFSSDIVFNNSILASGFFITDNTATFTATRSLFQGATGNNIDGLPTFVDAMNGDYRLAPGSLGIDAATLNLYSSAGGGFIDFAGAPRVIDDLNTSDTGTGSSTALDIGAFEFQGASTPVGTCPGDANGDGTTTTADITFVVSNLGCTSN